MGVQESRVLCGRRRGGERRGRRHFRCRRPTPAGAHGRSAEGAPLGPGFRGPRRRVPISDHGRSVPGGFAAAGRRVGARRCLPDRHPLAPPRRRDRPAAGAGAPALLARTASRRPFRRSCTYLA
jgi:hypothetical protein